MKIFKNDYYKQNSNPKILLVGSLPESNKVKLFLNYEKCKHSKHHCVGQQPAIGVQLNTLPFTYGQNQKISLDVWNIVISNERYRILAPIYMANAKAIVGVCSLTSLNSFEKMKYWLNKYREYYLERGDEELMKLLEEKIYILVYDDSCFVHRPKLVELSAIEQYGNDIGGKIFIVHQHSQGRDLSKFFDYFLNKISENNNDFDAEKRKLKSSDYIDFKNNYFSKKLTTRIKHLHRKLSFRSVSL